MNFAEHFGQIAKTMLAEFEQTAAIAHRGDAGVNREEILRQFLNRYLPSRYSVTKGEMVTAAGDHSHSADIIIFDAETCPKLYDGETTILPIEGVYGIVEVKSHLNKTQFLDAARKIEEFKRLAPRDLTVIKTREYVTLRRPSRPFGIVFGFDLGDNSLESLMQNWHELNEEIHDVNFFANLVCVLSAGVSYFEEIDLSTGEKRFLLDTDQLVELVEMVQALDRNKQPGADDHFTRIVARDSREESFGWFFVFLMIILNKMKLGVPDLGRYIDPSLPIQIVTES